MLVENGVARDIQTLCRHAPAELGAAQRLRSLAMAMELGLTKREYEVLPFFAEGHSRKQLTKILGVAMCTVCQYETALYRKCDVHSRTELLAFALRSGLLHLDELRHPYEFMELS